MRGHSSDWHGSAMQDTRTPSSTGFRRRCAAGRVTLERPKVTKGLLPRLFALLRRVSSVHPFVRRHAPMGFDLRHPWRRSKSATDILVLAPNRAEPCSSNSGLAPGPAALVRRPASRPGQTASPRRTTGGNPVPSARGQLTAPYLFGAMIGRVVISDPTLRPLHGEIRFPSLYNKRHQHGCIGKNYCECNSKRNTSLSGDSFILKARQ